jgi:uncharacterized membrane protein YedE/YeeE
MTVDAVDLRAPAPFEPLPIQRLVTLAGLIVLLVGAFFLREQGWRHAALFLTGGLMGLALYHAAFGFSAAYRRLFLQRDGRGVQAQLLMLAAGTMLFAPVLAEGSLFGQSMTGAIAPVGVQVAVGAFMFGIGMQLGGGCGSGTLFTVGGGSVRMLVTLAAMCAGSFWASLDMQWWSSLPRAPGIALGAELGWSVAALLQLSVFGAFWWLLRRYFSTSSPVVRPTLSRFFRGGWPLLWGALALALLNWLALVLSGHPWSITWAFTLWGAKAAQLVGWDPTGTWFWSGGFTEYALNNNILVDETSVMDIGIVLGALVAAGLAGKYRPGFRIPLASLLAAVLGGLMMGYGARIAYGCNIGAFFSGIASTSLRGWLWIVAALCGTWIGVKIRPLFGFSDEAAGETPAAGRSE